MKCRGVRGVGPAERGGAREPGSCSRPAPRYSRIVGGWDLLPRALLSSLSVPVVLHAPVTGITQETNEVRVHIGTSHRGRSLKTMAADVVLLTASGPALQRMKFSPPLSRKWQEALHGLHYMPSTKVFLSFRRPFWHDEHIMGGHSNTDRPSRKIVYPAPGEGSLLLASYTWSDSAASFSGLSQEETLQVALEDLAALHGPIVYRLWDGTGVVKRWADDPHSQGAFVVQPPMLGQDADKEDREEFNWATPYGRIYFAGEHTAYPHGWVETAVKSALRAAVLINSQEKPLPLEAGPVRSAEAPMDSHTLCESEKGGVSHSPDAYMTTPPTS